MRIRSYRALRPVPSKASTIASLPYDVVSTAEARALAEGNPLSMLRVVRADLEFPDGTDPYSEPVYARAKGNFDRLVSEGHLEREAAPSLYAYRQQMGTHSQTGVVALCHVDDYDAGLIKKHEKTRRDKEDDRTKLTGLLAANPGPVFLTYRDEASIDALVARASADTPLFDFTAPDGISHTVWRIDAPESVVSAFAPVPVVYIADGHHRAASAARVGRERRAANPAHRGDEDYNWFLTVLFPASQLCILPYNRLVADLAGRTPAQLLAEMEKLGPVAPAASPSPERPGEVCFFLDGVWRSLALSAPEGADPAARLDVSLLQDQVLAPLLGIDDPRTNKRIDFAGGIRGADYLEKEVRAGRAAIAFSMHPVTVAQLMDIADAGQIMPPKSTWFEPKLRSGLFMHTF
ncbi:DUF1015 family protein [Opitutales bacterium ASA1]|uniref:DUF1015 domain-containing protein n=1 Tax=Congregicoccus parvus TaxID=3081749 RepID=UPI002B31A720|nr:DUF1015 family protein [Opitutales bacterium ASA1]